MRNYSDRYKYIVCDIDDTLIYGWFTDLMRITWNIYKVNQFLKYILNNYEGQIIFLTARKECNATISLIEKILEDRMSDSVIVVALSTDYPEIDKVDFICNILPYGEVCVFDDNKKVIEECRFLDIDAFDARDFIDTKIG